MNGHSEGSTPDSPRHAARQNATSANPESGRMRSKTGPQSESGGASPSASTDSFKLNGSERASRPDSAEHGAFPLIDRRLGLNRREVPGATSAPNNGEATGLERRRGAGRRRTDFLKAADEGELTSEQFMFLMAIDAFKKSNERMYPTWSDVLEVIRLMGYRKTMPSELNLRNADDWTEAANTPAGVKNKQGKRAA